MPFLPYVSPCSSAISQSIRALPPAIQQVRLGPQRIGLELPERTLDPLPGLTISINLLPCPQTPRQQARLATEKHSARAQERVRRDIAQRAGFQQRSQVWDRFFAASGEFDGGGLFGGFEGAEHGGAVAAEAVGEEDAEGDADGAADCGVG